MNGGPGYSTIAGMYASGGAYIVDNVTMTIVRNPYAWNEIADTLFLDQPAGTGFSEVHDMLKVCHDISCIKADFLAFLLNLYKLYPKYKTRDFYIAGECYGGHFVPHIANHLLQEGKNKIPMKGYIVFSGFYDVLNQAPANLQFLLENGFVDKLKFGLLTAALWLCKQAADYKVPFLSKVCGQTPLSIYVLLGMTNDPYDIQRSTSTDIYDEVTKVYLNRKDVQEALGINRKLTMYNGTVYWGMMNDFTQSSLPTVGLTLDRGMKVMSVYGDKDYVCSHIGGLAVTESIPWVGQRDFLKQPFEDWKQNGASMASVKKVKNFSFIKVKNVGHSVFYRQRLFGLGIFKKLFENN